MDDANIVTSHARCLACGYELAGLPMSAVCPECARPVASSIVAAPFACLGNAAAARLASGLWHVVRGLTWGLAGSVLTLLAITTGVSLVNLGAIICLFVAWFLWGIGWWRVARVRTLFVPEPAPAARYTTLVLAALQFALPVLFFGHWFGIGWQAAALLLPANIVGTMIAGRVWLTALAEAAELPALAARAEILTYLQFVGVVFGVLTAFLVLQGGGPDAGLVGIFAVLIWLAAGVAMRSFLGAFREHADRRVAASRVK